MKKTKIICTLGPASGTKEKIGKLYDAGMDVARINMSHGSHEEYAKLIRNVRSVSDKIAILLDTKGPEIRTRRVKEPIKLKKGDLVDIRGGTAYCTSDTIFINYRQLHNEATPGTKIIIDDGTIELQLKRIQNTTLVCEVVSGGTLRSKKSVIVPSVNVKLPSVSKQDKDDINFAIKQKVDFLAASFVRSKEDVMKIRRILGKKRSPIQLIAKIESREGVRNLSGILEAVDGIMVARGDLGVGIKAEEVPMVQKRIIKECNLLGKPVITATQMLESMIEYPRPTRAETSDVANAILDGTDAIMLSAETAVGKYPIRAVTTMSRIAKNIESEADLTKYALKKTPARNITEMICKNAFWANEDLPVDAIIVPTESGYTARQMAKYKPKTPVIAVAAKAHVMRSLSLSWGILPTLQPRKAVSFNTFMRNIVRRLLDEKLLKKSDSFILVGGKNMGRTGSTNYMEISSCTEFFEN